MLVVTYKLNERAVFLVGATWFIGMEWMRSPPVGKGKSKTARNRNFRSETVLLPGLPTFATLFIYNVCEKVYYMIICICNKDMSGTHNS